MAISIPTDGYCEETDVERLTGKSYTTSTAPTSSQVEEIIQEKADTINGVLDAVGFSVPISGSATRSLRILQNLNAKGAAADAENAVPGISDESPRARAWRQEFEHTLGMLASRKLNLPDVSENDDMPTTPDNQNPGGSFNLDADGNESDPTFDRDTDL